MTLEASQESRLPGWGRAISYISESCRGKSGHRDGYSSFRDTRNVIDSGPMPPIINRFAVHSSPCRPDWRLMFNRAFPGSTTMTTRELDLLSQKQLAESRMRYADLFDFAPIGYATLNERGRFEEVNLACARLLGGTTRQFIGQAFADYVVEEARSGFREHLTRCRESGKRTQIELRLIPHHGDPTVVELYTVAGLEMVQGKLQFRCALINITERKHAEEALHRSQIELELRAKHHFLSEASAVFSRSLDYATVLESVVRMSIPRLADCCVVDIVHVDGSLKRDAVAHLDGDKEDLLRKLANLPGDRNEVFGKSKVIRTLRPELYAEMNDSLLNALARTPEHLQILRDLAFQSFICVPMVVRGNALGAMSFMRVQEGQRYTLFDLALAEDYADRAAMAVDNAMLFSKEQEANRLKDEFLAIVSHELRTPLTPILGAMYHLRSIRPSDNEAQAMARIVERNATAQSRLIDDLLDVSRVATGKFELSWRLADPQAIVEASANSARPLAETREISIEVTVPAEKAKPIYCDPNRIQQVLVNLLSNAIKFSCPGSPVKINMESQRSNLRITIQDQGKGIAPEFLPHVFEPFRQADRFITRSHGGLGLGLSIVYHIVREHGGNVRAQSAGEGKGATFIVDLPFSGNDPSSDTLS
jgi:PAS domain S-box-containing protein